MNKYVRQNDSDCWYYGKHHTNLHEIQLPFSVFALSIGNGNITESTNSYVSLHHCRSSDFCSMYPATSNSTPSTLLLNTNIHAIPNVMHVSYP